MAECTNPQAYNYNPTATVDDGSCQFPDYKTKLLETYCENTGTNTNPIAGTNETSEYTQTCHYFITMTPIDIFSHFFLVIFFFAITASIAFKIIRWLINLF